MIAHSDRAKLWFLLALCSAVRLSVFIWSQNYDGDPFARSLGALAWSQNPHWIWHASRISWVFGPLPLYLHGSALMLWPDVLLAPRVVNLILGSLAIIPFFKLVQLKLDSTKAWYASLVFCFYTLHVRFSTVATSEAIGSFFLIMAVYLFFRYLVHRKLSSLLLSAVALNLSTMVRYENIVFAPLLALLLFVEDSPQDWRLWRFNRAAVLLGVPFFALSVIFMISRMTGDYFEFGDPLHSIPLGKSGSASHTQMLLNDLSRRGFAAQLAYTLTFWPGVAFVSLTPAPAILAAIGLLRAAWAKCNLHLVIIFGLVFLPFEYFSTISRSIATFARFSLGFTIFLIPFAGAQWHHLHERIGARWKRSLDYAIVGSMMFFFVAWAFYGIEGRGSVLADKISSISPVSRLPVHVNELIAWLDKTTAPEDIIVLEDYNNESDMVRFYSKRGRDHYRARWKSEAELRGHMQNDQPQFIVVPSNGELQRLFNLQSQDSIQSSKGMTFRQRYENRVYRVFDVSYSAVIDWPAADNGE